HGEPELDRQPLDVRRDLLDLDAPLALRQRDRAPALGRRALAPRSPPARPRGVAHRVDEDRAPPRAEALAPPETRRRPRERADRLRRRVLRERRVAEHT